MYVQNILLRNYGPIADLNIRLPFNGTRPKPVVLVGENGSGKTVVLSQIVNGLVSAKQIAFPDSPEVEPDRVYKLRSSQYVKSDEYFYFAQVEYEEDLIVKELRTSSVKSTGDSFEVAPLPTIAQQMWNSMGDGENDRFEYNFSNGQNKDNIENIFAHNCVLYFPSDRYEDPAWLNSDSMTFQAHLDLNPQLTGSTTRKVINHSSMASNANYIYDLVYDHSAFERRTINVPINTSEDGRSVNLPLLLSPEGSATNTYNILLEILQLIIGQKVAFYLGRRRNRTVALISDGKIVVPNIFQLSSGESALLNIFLTIVRDFESSGASFSTTEEIRGIVVVDEIDLHLHTKHQYEILPGLIARFPNVQFIVTSHSPLFVLGMKELFGEDGFTLYDLPSGVQIYPEEFNEFGHAHDAFVSTQKFAVHIRRSIEESQKSIVYVEGDTDIAYFEKAVELHGKQSLLDRIDFRFGNSNSGLNSIWRLSKTRLSQDIAQKLLCSMIRKITTIQSTRTISIGDQCR